MIGCAYFIANGGYQYVCCLGVWSLLKDRIQIGALEWRVSNRECTNCWNQFVHQWANLCDRMKMNEWQSLRAPSRSQMQLEYAKNLWNALQSPRAPEKVQEAMMPRIIDLGKIKRLAGNQRFSLESTPIITLRLAGRPQGHRDLLRNLLFAKPIHQGLWGDGLLPGTFGSTSGGGA